MCKTNLDSISPYGGGSTRNIVFLWLACPSILCLPHVALWLLREKSRTLGINSCVGYQHSYAHIIKRYFRSNEGSQGLIRVIIQAFYDKKWNYIVLNIGFLIVCGILVIVLPYCMNMNECHRLI